MISDQEGIRLHDKVTRGRQLTDEEQLQLDSWYDHQDTLEHELLTPISEENTVATVHAQIETTLTHLMMITKRIQEVASENDRLRKEVNQLRQQLINTYPIRQAA